MQHEKAIVKKAVKSYTTVKGEKKESISVNINLGAKSEFNDGDKVAVLPIADFNKVKDIDVDEIQQLKNDIADNDSINAANNERIIKLNAELENKFDIINDVTAKYKSSEKTIVKLRDDISAKDKRIVELESALNVAETTIDDVTANNDDLHLKLNNLSDTLSNKNSIIEGLDKQIAALEKEIAVLKATDISGLKEKANELDIVKDKLDAAKDDLIEKTEIIALSENQIKEYALLVSYKDKKIERLENKGVFDYILNKNVTADIDLPSLKLIDQSGNPTANIRDNIIDANVKSDDSDDDDSGKDNLTIV